MVQSLFYRHKLHTFNRGVSQCNIALKALFCALCSTPGCVSLLSLSLCNDGDTRKDASSLSIAFNDAFEFSADSRLDGGCDGSHPREKRGVDELLTSSPIQRAVIPRGSPAARQNIIDEPARPARAGEA